MIAQPATMSSRCPRFNNDVSAGIMVVADRRRVRPSNSSEVAVGRRNTWGVIAVLRDRIDWSWEGLAVALPIFSS